MAETFVSNIVENVLGRLKSPVFEEVCLALPWDCRSELKKLENSLSTIKPVLVDAEKQHASNDQLRNLLGKLKEVCYDADDVLDELEIEGLQQRKVWSFCSHPNSLVFSSRMGHKIKDIRVNLDDNAPNIARFVYRHRVQREGEEIHPFERQSNIIGRDSDRDHIVENLMKSSDDKNASIMIPIVGIGGIGKTTLAKMVYNDERVATHFEVKKWVHVSEELDLNKLCASIISEAMGEKCDNLKEEQTQTRLGNSLRDKKCLLVLDNVWNENHGKWSKLKDLLMSAGNGNKVILTTRSQGAAETTEAPLYNLDGLSDEDCLKIFIQWAFREGEENKYRHLLKIGKEIVEKCHGNPLAAKTLGSLLFMKTNKSDWLSVKDNEIWKLEQKESDILPALRLSYNQLPPHLKQCFAYCSIFPKDSVFSNMQLIQLWMAEGLIHSPDQNPELEEIGEGYIRELWSRSFIEEQNDEWLFLRGFKIQDLVHDLALSVAQTEFSVFNWRTPEKFRGDGRVRRVSFSDAGDESEFREVPKSLLALNHLRTIHFPPVSGREWPISTAFVDTCISRFKCLRVLELYNSRLEELPPSIGNLKHLRYLDLGLNYRIKRLPNSICKLQSLQTLILQGCEKLEEVPREIQRLSRLRCLAITTKEKFLAEKGIERLTSLRLLWIDNCGNLENLPQKIQCLTSLRTLVIGNCRSLALLESGVQNLTALENLVIFDCEKLRLEMDGKNNIQDLRNLRSLWIEGLPGLEDLPRWLLLPASAAVSTAAGGVGASNTLQQLHIEDCSKLRTLPEWLGDLSSLRKLEIVECPGLQFLPEGMRRLTALSELNIKHCPELIRRCKEGRREDWPKIAHVPKIDLDGDTSRVEMKETSTDQEKSASFKDAQEKSASFKGGPSSEAKEEQEEEEEEEEEEERSD